MRPRRKKFEAEIPGSFVVKADLSTTLGRKALLDSALRQGTPYVLVNNAGVDKPHEPVLMIEESSFETPSTSILRDRLFS